jgi:hypothetical protein
MIDVFDRAATLNFTCVISVRGRLTQAALQVALRKLERRHPLLRARIERRKQGAVFVHHAAAAIPLRVLEREPADWQALVESSLVHRIWSDAGPRAELTWLRHGPSHSTLLLTCQHVVSDACSGFVALRDLLGFVADPTRVAQPMASPGQSVLYPEQHGDSRWSLRGLKLVASSLTSGKPKRLRQELRRDAHRSPKVTTLTFSAEHTKRIVQRAREYDASLHGVICAALAKGYIEAGHWPTASLRLCHPVDLRRYARSQRASQKDNPLQDAVGCYVSSLATEHVVTEHAPLGALAHEITRAVRRKKASGEPWLTLPLTRPWLARPVTDRRDLTLFADFIERNVLLDSFCVSSLGEIEKTGLLPTTIGSYRIEQAFFVSGSSLVTAMTTATSMFAGKLTLAMQWVEPLITVDVAKHVLGHAERELREFSMTGRSSGHATLSRA